MEIEFFCHAGRVDEVVRVLAERAVRLVRQPRACKSEKLRLRDQGPEELAHYSKACADIEYLFPFSDEPRSWRASPTAATST